MVSPWLVGIVPALGVVTAIRAVTHRGGSSRRRSLSSSSSGYMHGDAIMDGYVKKKKSTMWLFVFHMDAYLYVYCCRGQGGTDPNFICERVCTSNRLMRRMGGLAKDITPNTCVTVCGVSPLDACTEACQQAVCTSMHQVPAWNEACISRCSTECQKRGRHQR